jgi:preflagellin peptidase FlaK
MLGYGSYKDWKTREIPDTLWLLFSVIAISIIIPETIIDFNLNNLYMMLISIGITAIISVILYYFGFFGGADMKALIVLSLLLPIYLPFRYIHPLLPIISFTNAIFITASFALGFFMYNAFTRYLFRKNIFNGFEKEPIWKKIIVSFLGFRASRVRKDSFYMTLEKIVDNEKKFDISLMSEDEDFASGEDMWVTPGIPLLIFITIGFVVSIVYGDFLTLIVHFP